jgi:hypothetical protein
MMGIASAYALRASADRSLHPSYALEDAGEDELPSEAGSRSGSKSAKPPEAATATLNPRAISISPCLLGLSQMR